MLYYLYEEFYKKPDDGIQLFNLFRYISFRGMGAAATAFILSLLAGQLVIRKLMALKFGQPVRSAEEVHKLHELHGKKAGTPTMGGILIITTVTISTILWARPDNPFIWLCLTVLIVLSGLGFVDDYLKVKFRNSKGVSGRWKMAVQAGLAVGVTVWLTFIRHPDPAYAGQMNAVYLPFFKQAFLVDLGWFAVVFFGAVIVGSSNAVNLTDGLDGLAIGCTIASSLAFACLCYMGGHVKMAGYLDLPYHPWRGEIAIFCMAMVEAGIGFLWYNAHPAQVFMGDTGSLALGGALGAVAICCKQELLLVVIGGVFVIEALSVILQVLSFKLTGRRIFMMSPIHHHFELKGWHESTVIVRFWILAIVFALMGLATLKVR